MTLIRALIYSLLICVLLFVAIKKRDSKKLFLFVMLMCWVMIALSMDAYDVNNYRYAYEQGIVRGKEPFFDILQFVFKGIGVPFNSFKVLYCTVIWFLLFNAMQKYTKELALAAIFFVFGPMIGFGTQLRSTMAGVIVLNALPYLLKKDAKIWKYCGLVAVACGFHLMAAFYFVFLIPKFIKTDSEKFRNVLCIIALVMIPLILLLANPVSRLLLLISEHISIGFVKSALLRIVPYLSGELSPSIKGFLYNSCAQLVVFFVTDRMCVVLKRLRREGSHIDGSQLYLSEYAVSYLQKINSILVLIVPCYIMCMQFDRFYNYYTPVCYCLIAQGLRELRLTGIKAPIKGVLELSFVKKLRFLYWKKLGFLNNEEKGILQPGNFELTLLVSCMLFCLVGGTWISGPGGLAQITNSISILPELCAVAVVYFLWQFTRKASK